MSSSRTEQKRRISKNEKIAELQSKLKILADENKRLKVKLERDSTSNSCDDEDGSYADIDGIDDMILGTVTRCDGLRR